MIKTIKELNEAYDKILEGHIKEANEGFSVGDIVKTQKLSGSENRFFGIIQGFDEFKDDEEAYNSYRSDKIILIKPLCTVNGDTISVLHDLDENGNLRMGNNSRITKVDKNQLEKAKNQAVDRAHRFEEIMRNI